MVNSEFAGIVNAKLREDNYDNWKLCMKSYFISQGLWDIVTGKETEPEEKSSPAYEDWIKKNAMALHAILVSCHPETMSKCCSDSAHVEWERLAKKARNLRLKARISFIERQAEVFEYRDLYNAVAKGDWDTTRDFLDKKPCALKEKITLMGDTVFHVAVIAGKIEILDKLLEKSEPEDINKENDMGYTAFSIAAINGSQPMVEAMLAKDANLVNLKDGRGLIPIVAASIYSAKHMVRYLYEKTPAEMLSPDHPFRSGATLLNCLITDEDYELAIQLLEKYPVLGFKEDFYENFSIRLLARKQSAFPSGNKYAFWKKLIYSCISAKLHIKGIDDKASNQAPSDEESIIRCYPKQIGRKILEQWLNLFWVVLTWCVPDLKAIYEKKVKHVQVHRIVQIMLKQIPHVSEGELEIVNWNRVIYDAIENGISELMDEMIKNIPEMAWRKDKKGRTIFANAIVLRQEKIFSHIYRLEGKMNMAIIEHDIFANNYLHLAAKLSPISRLDRFSGAALQMQREYEWFKEVQNLLPARFREETNDNNKTPSDVFRDEHQELMKEGERWMKSTAASCMVVATLIAAVMFTSAFTVPGGNNDRTGIPIFLKEKAFLIFIISNALSLFLASTSIIIFLGILTSRYAETDFHKLLPTKLIIGLLTLFFSIVTMMAAFGSANFLLLKGRMSWAAIPLIAFSLIPISLFVTFEFPLLIETLIRTFGGNAFDKPKKRVI